MENDQNATSHIITLTHVVLFLSRMSSAGVHAARQPNLEHCGPNSTISIAATFIHKICMLKTH